MTNAMPANVAASIRQKLLNLAGKPGAAPNIIWSRCVIERLPYRLSVSEFSREFIRPLQRSFMRW